MGFFKALKNIALGKPVFEVAQQKPSVATPHSTVGPKVVPQMYVERTNCRTTGHDMEVEIVVQNYSQQELILDKVELLGKAVYLNAKQVSPGEEDDLAAYEGTRPKNTYDTQCLLYYKNESGDYFCSVHTVEYQQLPDGTYMVRNIRFTNVKDV